MRRFWTLVAMLITLASGLVVIPATPAAAGDAEVSGACDEPAFDAALSNVQGTGGGTITFACGAEPVTITLASQKVISASVVIDGGGLVTLDGEETTRIFRVDTGASLELREIRLTGGAGSGGAILNSAGGTLTITDSTLIGNGGVGSLGGAIYNQDGSVTVIASTLSNNGGDVSVGGAIYNEFGMLQITSSTLSANGGDDGIGNAIAAVGGTVTIANSTLNGNTSVGGIGGAMAAIGSTVMITNSTLSGNGGEDSVGGAVSVDGGTVTIAGSTLVGNTAGSDGLGGAIFNDAGTVELHTSIIAGGDSGTSVTNCTGDSIDSLGLNIVDDDSCNLNTDLGDIPNTDPLLDALDDYGGQTRTHRPQPSSPAIDRIPSEECAAGDEEESPSDQRGVSRPQNGLCDIGSVEVLSVTLCIDRVSGGVRGQTSAGCGRLEQAVSLEYDGPVTLCANRVTGGLRMALRGDCGRTEQAIVQPGDGPVTVCVNRVTGSTRIAANGTCSRYEVQQVIG